LGKHFYWRSITPIEIIICSGYCEKVEGFNGNRIRSASPAARQKFKARFHDSPALPIGVFIEKKCKNEKYKKVPVH
jgi:hypothetical protein